MNRKFLVSLLAMGVLSAIVYAIVLQASFDFEPTDEAKSRPILKVLGLFGVAFAAYFVAIFSMLRGGGEVKPATSESRPKFWTGSLFAVLFFGIVFRGIMICSAPIQEVDIYRYIWDGMVSNAGVDPYLFPPSSIQAISDQPDLPAPLPDTLGEFAGEGDLTKLKHLATSGGPKDILALVHYSHYTTPYPPVSQLVFSTSSKWLTADSSKRDLLLAMKFAIVLFDVGTAVLVAVLLFQVGLPTSWSVAYCWCPLVLKEFANSGHLDSIAVFFCSAALVATLLALNSSVESKKDSAKKNSLAIPTVWLVAAAVFLALGVGSKLYPVVLFPLWATLCLRQIGWRALAPIATFAIVTFVVCWPFAKHIGVVKENYTTVMPSVLRSAFPTADQTQLPEKDNAGIDAFLKSWEMNDFLFMCVVENLKLEDERKRKAWFSVVDDANRIAVRRRIDQIAGKHLDAFFVTRLITLALFCGIVMWSLIGLLRQPTARCFLRMAFLTLAWFWLLSPTQNPWYWSWALPLVVFAGSRTWLLVAALSMLYYCRFYFIYHYPPGAELTLFDHYFPWYEFGTVFVLLICEWCFRRFKIQ